MKALFYLGPRSIALMAAAIISAFASSGRADNGTASYLDFNGSTAGFGSPTGTISYSGSVWSTASDGTATLTTPVDSAQLTFGSIGSDLAGATFTLDLDANIGFTGISINSTSANITLSGGANTPSNSNFGDGTMSWTVASGSTLNMNANYGGTGGINNYGSPLTLRGGGIINFGGVIGMNGSTNITQNMAGGTVNLQQTNAGGAPYSGGYTLTAGTLNFQGIGAAASAFSSMASGKIFAINGGTIDNITGVPGGAMSIGDGTYSIGGDFTFIGSNAMGLGNAAVDLGSSVRQITVAANSFGIGGITSGTGGITKLGAGVLSLNGANTYTGATTIGQGTLRVGVASVANVSGALGNNSAVTIANVSGATLNLANSNTQIGSLTGGGTTGGNVMLGTATLTIGGDNTTPSAYAGTLSGTGGITKIGNGTLTLSGANTYTGSSTVSSGTWLLAQTASLYNGSTASWTKGNISVASGGTLAVNVGGAGEFTAGNVTTLLSNLTTSIDNNGLLNGSNIGFDTTNATGGAFTLADNITNSTGFGAGSLGVTKMGSNTLVLTGANTYTGSTSVSSGTLQVDTNDALGTNAAGTSVSAGAALKLNGVNYSSAEAVSLNGTGISNGGALVNSGTSTFAGQITAATNATVNAGGGTLNLTGGLVKNGTIATLMGGGRVNITGTGISGASANSDLVVDGTTVVVSAASNYNGPTTVQNNATFVANAEITTTSLTVNTGSTVSGTGSIENGAGLVNLNGALVVGDSTLGSPVASQFEIGGTGSTLLGNSSSLSFDIFTRGGDLTGTASSADRLKLFGALDTTLGGTLILGNPSTLSGFAAGDTWTLFDLTSGGSISAPFASVNYSALGLTGGLFGGFDPETGVFSILEIPEPSRALLLGLGLAGLGLRRRRSRVIAQRTAPLTPLPRAPSRTNSTRPL